MNNLCILLAGAFAFAAAGLAQSKILYKVPLTVDGKPDPQGIWMTRNAAAFDVGEVAEGRQIPLSPRSARAGTKGRPRGSHCSLCAMPGVPRITYMPFPFKIIERPGYVVFLYEYQHDHRIVPTTPPAAPRRHRVLPGRFGRPLGRQYAGDRCNEPERQNMAGFRSPHAQRDALHVVERLTRTDADTTSSTRP